MPEPYETDGMASLYAIKSENGPVKVGVSNDVAVRLRVLQTASAYPLSVVHQETVGVGEARAIEKAAHTLLSEMRLCGEWFDADEDAVRAAITEAIELVRNDRPAQCLKPAKAIRAKCLDCCGGQAGEVRKCVSIDCALWPFRMGINPFHGRRAA